MQDSRAPLSIDPEVLLAALAEPERLALYLSQGTGPGLRNGEQPEFVRVALLTRASPAAVQAAAEAWLAAGETLGVGPLRRIEAIELVAPTRASPWAAVPADDRATLLRGGVTSLLALAPELGVFHVNDEFGAGMLLRLQSGAATGEPRLDARLLEHLVFAALTYRLLVHTGEAVAGLGLASLAETLVWATSTRRGRAEVAAGPGAIAAVLAEAEADLRPRLTNLLRERPGGGN